MLLIVLLAGLVLAFAPPVVFIAKGKLPAWSLLIPITVVAAFAALTWVRADRVDVSMKTADEMETAADLADPLTRSVDWPLQPADELSSRSILDPPAQIDLYPSRLQAAEAVGRGMAHAINLRLLEMSSLTRGLRTEEVGEVDRGLRRLDPGSGGEEKWVVSTLFVTGSTPASVRDAVIEVINASVLTDRVHVALAAEEPAPDDSLVLQLDRAADPQEGELLARLQLGDQQVVASTRYVHTPWMLDFDAWSRAQQARQPGTGFLALESGPGFVEQAAAEKHIVEMLAASLLEQVRNEIRRQVSKGELPSPADVGRSKQLESLVATLAENPDLWKQDQFVQRTQARGAPSVRVAALVKLSQERMEKIACQAGELVAGTIALAKAAETRRKFDQLFFGLAIAALLLGVTMLYLVANSATRGYYLWRLRLASVACMAAGLAAIYHFLPV